MEELIQHFKEEKFAARCKVTPLVIGDWIKRQTRRLSSIGESCSGGKIMSLETGDDILRQLGKNNILISI